MSCGVGGVAYEAERGVRDNAVGETVVCTYQAVDHRSVVYNVVVGCDYQRIGKLPERGNEFFVRPIVRAEANLQSAAHLHEERRGEVVVIP